MKLKNLFFVVVPVLPLIFRVLYLPVEDAILWNRMGWTSDSINNLASKVFMPVACICSLLVLIRTSSQIGELKKRYAYLVAGGLIQVMLTLLCMTLYVFRGIHPEKAEQPVHYSIPDEVEK